MKKTQKHQKTTQTEDQGTKRTQRTKTSRLGKPRGDSTLDGLAPERREQIESWLLDENKGYREVRDLMAREWGVLTSHSAVGRYYTQRLVPRQLLEAKEAAVGMCPPSPRLRRGDDSFGEAALQRARMLGFMALMEPVPDANAARVYLGIVDRIERRELARDRIALSERLVKLRELRDTPPPPPPPLTEDEYWEKYNSIFGLEYGYRPPHVRAAMVGDRGRETGDGTAVGCRSHGGDEANEQGSSQPGMAPMAQMGAIPARSAEGGTRSAESQTAASEITSEITITGASGEGSAETGVGPAAGCRSHGSEVSFGRVLGSESGAAGFGDPALQRTAATSGQQAVTGRAVGDSLRQSPGGSGSFHVGTAGHAVIFAGDVRGNYWPRPVWSEVMSDK